MKGNFKKLIAADTPVLVDFFAEWCGPCKMQAPILKDLAQELKGNVRILKIDIDKNQSLADQYQVKGVPTLILFKNGKTVWRKSGLLEKNQLAQVILEKG